MVSRPKNQVPIHGFSSLKWHRLFSIQELVQLGKKKYAFI